jgi:NTE family protein
MEVPISAISGASIGALNGAVAASSSSLSSAAERLENLWSAIAEDPPLGDSIPNSLRLLEAAGLRLGDDLKYTARFAHEVAHNLMSSIRSPETGALVDNSRIRKMVAEYVSVEQLAAGIPLYVSVFPNRNTLETLLGAGLARLRIKKNPDSEFLRVQSLPPEDQHTALLASSAIPFLLEAQEIDGETYVDGGLGGLDASRGNTPLTPLMEHGCNPVIVTHLSDRSAWSRQEHPETALIQIERFEKIGRTPVLPEIFDVISFQPKKIRSWIEQGYSDTIRSVKPWLKFII